MSIKLLASVVALGLLATSAVAAPPVRYEVNLIEGPLVGGLTVTAMNNRGAVVGTRGAPDGQFAFWWREGRFVDLQRRIDPTASFLEATGINNRSQIVGFYLDPATSTFRGFLIDRRRTSEVLGPPEAEAVFLGAINDREQILGSFFDASFNEGYFLNENGNVLVFESGFLPVDVNSSGTVSGTDVGSGRAALWEDGVITPIGPPASSGSRLNDRGQVIGITTENGVSRGFVWHRGTNTLLPPVPGSSTHSFASDINNRGRVVGQSTNNSSTRLATIWNDGEPTDLNTLINPNDPLRPFVTLTTANLINDRGQIVALGRDSRVGFLQYYFLDPVRRIPAGSVGTPESE